MKLNGDKCKINLKYVNYTCKHHNKKLAPNFKFIRQYDCKPSKFICFVL